jgi:hypothetical protein
MRGSKAKALRKIAKENATVKETSYIHPHRTPTLYLEPNCERALYQALKQEGK